MKFWEKMSLIMILKVTKKDFYSLSLSLKNLFLEKPQRGSQIDPQAVSGLREYSDNYSKTSEFITIL